MGIIGRFIDDACARHPDLMRRVLDRPFGDVQSWINFDEEGEACGCLIGTVALCAGFAGRAVMSWADLGEMGSIVSLATGSDYEVVGMVGASVAEVSVRLGKRAGLWNRTRRATPESNALTVELLKRRIARSLGVVYGAPKMEAAHV